MKYYDIEQLKYYDTDDLTITIQKRGYARKEFDRLYQERIKQKINDKLEGTPFKVAYRTRNEFLLYVVNNLPYNKDEKGGALKEDYVIQRALDEITSMKILSRIEGDKRSIGNLLQDLQQVIDESYPASNKKLVQMAETLQDKQFVSYWT